MSDPLGERCRLSARQASVAPPPFIRLATFEFYDGPESGLAETMTGEAYRFEAFAESRYRRYRAYLLDHLLAAPSVWGDGAGWLTADDWAAIRLISAGARYVGIGDLWLGGLVVRPLESDAVEPTNFVEAHNFLRSKFLSADRPSV